jgi:hypothetical protein
VPGVAPLSSLRVLFESPSVAGVTPVAAGLPSVPRGASSASTTPWGAVSAVATYTATTASVSLCLEAAKVGDVALWRWGRLSGRGETDR